MNFFLNFDYFALIKVKGQWVSPDAFFFSLPASMAVLFFILSAGITVIRGK